MRSMVATPTINFLCHEESPKRRYLPVTCLDPAHLAIQDLGRQRRPAQHDPRHQLRRSRPLHLMPLSHQLHRPRSLSRRKVQNLLHRPVTGGKPVKQGQTRYRQALGVLLRSPRKRQVVEVLWRSHRNRQTLQAPCRSLPGRQARAAWPHLQLRLTLVAVSWRSLRRKLVAVSWRNQWVWLKPMAVSWRSHPFRGGWLPTADPQRRMPGVIQVQPASSGQNLRAQELRL
mmetsp:Transcript_46377/g.123194  ORF Transcript_46377/g.123194 Transcript_46377/m.123194 type:complete len:229 (+) Transcript_46377:895-1581(+)